MNKPTFKEQSEKIIQAYLKCEINPWDPCACFVGNLLNNSGEWIKVRRFNPWMRGKIDSEYLGTEIEKNARTSVKLESFDLYSLEEILSLEKYFLDRLGEFDDSEGEEGLFQAMIFTLNKLRELHISKGEIIEEEVTLQKRQLV